MKLGDLSTHRVVSVGPKDSITDAVAVLEEHGIQHLPVVVGREIVGILSDRDIMIGCGDLAIANQSDSLELGKVEDIMSAPVYTLSPDDVLRSATWLMTHRRVHAIPLVHRDHLVGIVTESDLLRTLLDGHTTPESAVAEVMFRNVETVNVNADAGVLTQLFARDLVGIVVNDAIVKIAQ